MTVLYIIYSIKLKSSILVLFDTSANIMEEGFHFFSNNRYYELQLSSTSRKS